jgi:hypothetical protein
MAVTNWLNHQKEQGNIEEMADEANFDDMDHFAKEALAALERPSELILTERINDARVGQVSAILEWFATLDLSANDVRVLQRFVNAAKAAAERAISARTPPAQPRPRPHPHPHPRWNPTHHVVRGEKLFNIARHYYEDANCMAAILAANPPDVLPDENTIYADSDLVIPDRWESPNGYVCVRRR